MADVKFRPYRPDDAAVRLRQIDRIEAYELTAMTSQAAIEMTARLSDGVTTCLIDGEIGAIGGVTRPNYLGVGLPWVVATDAMSKAPTLAWLGALRGLHAAAHRYRVLEGFVRPDNEDALKWLRRLGFEIDEPAPVGAFGLPYCRYWMIPKCA